MKNWITNGIGLGGAYGISLAEFTGVAPIPQWVGVMSALAGVALTFSLVSIRLAEARKAMAEGRRLEIENDILIHHEEHKDEYKNLIHETDTHEKPDKDKKG